MDRAEIQKIVEEVIKSISTGRIESLPPDASGGPFFDSMEQAIEQSVIAQKRLQSLGMEKRKEIIEAMRKVSIKEAERLAKLANEETGMGRWEDKVQKNLLAANKTPGVEDLQPVISYTGDKGLTLVERAPFGVIGAVTPSTNPTSTVINNAIIVIAAGNSVVFAPHPAAKRSSQEAMLILQNAIEKVGGPKCLITSVKEPSLEEAEKLFTDKKVKVLLVTGGPAVVKHAMKTGKKTVAAGPGNPPVIVDETAVFPKCAYDIISGASFDNGILCTAEKEVIVLEKAKDRFLEAMRSDKRAFELTASQMDELAKINIKEPGRSGKEGSMNRTYIGKNASLIAKSIGLNISDGVRLLWGIVDKNHPYVWTEQLQPVLPVTFVKDIDEAIEFAVEVEHENHHTFIMHSLNVDNLTRMARACQGSIFVKNGPSYMGLGMGEGYGALSIATPTGEGLTSPKTFTRPLRCVLVDYFRIA